jgi:hypothetical protein
MPPGNSVENWGSAPKRWAQNLCGPQDIAEKWMPCRKPPYFTSTNRCKTRQSSFNGNAEKSRKLQNSHLCIRLEPDRPHIAVEFAVRAIEVSANCAVTNAGLAMCAGERVPKPVRLLEAANSRHLKAAPGVRARAASCQTPPGLRTNLNLQNDTTTACQKRADGECLYSRRSAIKARSGIRDRVRRG